MVDVMNGWNIDMEECIVVMLEVCKESLMELDECTICFNVEVYKELLMELDDLNLNVQYFFVHIVFKQKKSIIAIEDGFKPLVYICTIGEIYLKYDYTR